MKKSILFSLILISVCWLACQKKSMDVKIVESACDKFTLSNGQYQYYCNNNTSLTHKVRITLDFNADVHCIKKIYVKPVFYSTANYTMDKVSYTPQPVLISDTGVVVNGKHLSFWFTFTFKSKDDADIFKMLKASIYTENEYDNKSQTLIMDINSGCADNTLIPVTAATVTVSVNYIPVVLRDFGDEDGDTITLKLNGITQLYDYKLKNAGETFYYSLLTGSNALTITAQNEGSIHPNTTEIKINGVKKILSLHTGETATITVIY